MKIAIPKERRPGETRCRFSDLVKNIGGLGFDVAVEKGAGASAMFTDNAYKMPARHWPRMPKARSNRPTSTEDPATDLEGEKNELSLMKQGAVLIGHLGALYHPDDVAAYAAAGITAFAMELMPRISRAQSMDILSSQTNLAGYKAVLDAAAEYGSALPMMMTAAGTIAPAKVFVMGAGVAGLQAIATAKRMGAVVTATDVRPATREQVQSLGGKFLTVDAEMEKDAETAGGYAKAMPPEYLEKQKQVVAEHIKKQNIVITTPHSRRAAPVLVTEDMVKTAARIVIVELAVELAAMPEIEAGKVVVSMREIIATHVPGRLPTDAVRFSPRISSISSPPHQEGRQTIEFDWKTRPSRGAGDRDGSGDPLLTAKEK
jgi:NAD(P) transhydrogenase subunit alpha